MTQPPEQPGYAQANADDKKDSDSSQFQPNLERGVVRVQTHHRQLRPLDDLAFSQVPRAPQSHAQDRVFGNNPRGKGPHPQSMDPCLFQ